MYYPKRCANLKNCLLIRCQHTYISACYGVDKITDRTGKGIERKEDRHVDEKVI
jgi:hypothetical protein